MLQYKRMCYSRIKKVLLIAALLVIAVLVTPVKDAYAESFVEPSKKTCHIRLSIDGKLEGDNEQGYWCSTRISGNYNAFLECPSGSWLGSGASLKEDGVAKKRCVSGSRSTVEPTAKGCSSSSWTLKGDKNSGYFCENSQQIKPYSFTCPAGSKQSDGNSIGYGSGNVTFAQICVIETSTPTAEGKEKAKAAGAEAAGKDLLAKTPELASITSDPKVVGECIEDARSKAAASSRYARGSGGTSEELREQFLAECLASKTGKSTDEVKTAIHGADIKGAITAGEERESAVEAEEGSKDEPKKECGTEIEWVGYIVCPALEHLTRVADFIWSMFNFLLQTDPLPNGDSPLRTAWSGLRDIANGILAIVFLVITISQVSNIGISNYGIKKIMPRLIIAAIAINISYFLMQIVVDIANILGNSLYDFISDLAPSVNPSNLSWQTIVTDILSSVGLVIGTIAVGKAASSAAAGADPKVALMLVFILIVPLLLGLIAGLMTLLFRAGIIPVLAITSPIAIAAWVLPNTQKLFEKWKSTFLNMVFLYPLASLYCGGLKFTALTILSTKTDATEVLFRLMAVTIIALGCLVVPVLAIKSNSLVGGMINGIRGIASKITKPAVTAASGYAGALAGAAKAKRRSEIASRDYSEQAERKKLASRHDHSPLRLATKIRYALGRRRQAFVDDARVAKARQAAFDQEAQRKFDARVASDPSFLGEAAGTVGGKAYIRETAYKAAKMELDGKYGGNAVDALNRSNDEYVKALAAKEIAERGGAGEISKVREYLENGGTIVNTDMAEALQKMKKRDVGVAEVGSKAMDKLKSSGGRPVDFSRSEIAQLTREAFRNVGGDEQAAQQNATAIRDSGMSWQTAAKILGDRHIVRSTPDNNIEAIKANLEAGLAEGIKNSTISQREAVRITTNDSVMDHISNDDIKNRLLEIAQQGQQGGGGQRQSGGGQGQQGGGQGQQSGGQ